MAASRMRWRRMARRTMTTNKSWGIGVARGARRIVVEMTAAMRVRMMRSERVQVRVSRILGEGICD